MHKYTLEDIKRLYDEAVDILKLQPQPIHDDVLGMVGYDKVSQPYIDRLEAWAVEGAALQTFLIKKDFLKEVDQVSFGNYLGNEDSLRSFTNRLSRIIELCQLGKLTLNDQLEHTANHTTSLSVAKEVDPKKVFVIHGRNLKIQRAMFDFLRAIGLNPIEWNEAVKMTKIGAPYNGHIVEKALSQAKAAIVLLTGDDEARLRSPFVQERDADEEKRLTPQARLNVIFEAGMAFGTHPEKTILVEFEKQRTFSDADGRNVIVFDGSTQKRQELANRLDTIGCAVNLTGTHWHSAGDFSVETSKAPENSSLGQDKQIAEKWKFDGQRYWKIDSQGNVLEEEGAYCQVCKDKDEKEIRLQKLDNGFYSCGVCKKAYGRWKEGDGTIQLIPQRRRSGYFR